MTRDGSKEGKKDALWKRVRISPGALMKAKTARKTRERRFTQSRAHRQRQSTYYGEQRFY
jgi:hypothetical protein